MIKGRTAETSAFAIVETAALGSAEGPTGKNCCSERARGSISSAMISLAPVTYTGPSGSLQANCNALATVALIVEPVLTDRQNTCNTGSVCFSDLGHLVSSVDTLSENLDEPHLR